MRCYFMRGGHIAGVENLTASTDAEAIDKSKALFRDPERARIFDGFEVWDRERHVFRFP